MVALRPNSLSIVALDKEKPLSLFFSFFSWNVSFIMLADAESVYITVIGQLNIVASKDTCVWNLGPNGTFTVKDARNIIDQKTLPSLPSTSWDKIIPHKNGPSMDDGPDVGNGCEASSSVISNVGYSPSPADNVPNLISFATKVFENYVKNTWEKLILVKSMMIKDMHFFKFSSKEEMEVKFHDVPIIAFTEDGLSAIATKNADGDLRDTIVVVVPKFSSEGFTMSTIRVEYEWAPPRCSECKVKWIKNGAKTGVYGFVAFKSA
ncbi:hypothetical protein Tco_0064665 [Tanacetum coccineum]